jgi:2-polyprenyl-3-methyl-5-hydroxy-6-metoxy-1,4-benzoquinol methylase
MIFKQKVNYQKIDGKKGRDCSERWNFMEPFIEISPESWHMDIGSAEGYFSKKLAERTGGRVVSVEGSEHTFKRQKSYCNQEITEGKIILIHTQLGLNNIDFFTAHRSYDTLLLLSVLHWFDKPDEILKHLSAHSKQIIIELPELNDKKAWNQPYIGRIEREFGSLEAYLKAISGMNIEAVKAVSAHTSEFRRVFVLRH